MQGETTLVSAHSRSTPQPLAAAVTVERSEWTFPLFTALVLLVLTTIPYLWAWATAPADRVFMGMLLNVPDHMQYFSWMRELSTAHLAANKLTPEPNAPVFFNLLWWGLGRIGGLLGLGYAAMFQLLRWTAGPLALLLIYRMVSWFIADRLARRTAFLVAVLSSGFGWVLVVLKYTVTDGVLFWPLDLYVAEPNTFYSLLASPHFIAALLYIAVFDLFLRAHVTGRQAYAVLAGVVALLMGWQHAYDLLIVYGVLGAFALGLWVRDGRFPARLVLSLGIVGGLSVWPALYSVLLTSLDPLWREVLAQFDNAGVFTPPIYRLPVLLGTAFLLALYEAIRRRPWQLRMPGAYDDARLFLHGWFWVSFLLVYLPVDYQIHMLNGWQVPIAALATIALFDSILPAVRRRWNPNAAVETTVAGEIPRNWQRGRNHFNQLEVWGAAMLLVIVIPTNLYLFAWRFVDLARWEAPYSLSRDETAALEWLEGEVAPDDVILASLTFGQFVPAHTGAFAFLAHWAETVDFHGKREQVEQFYTGHLAEAAEQSMLKEFSIDYVVFGPLERAVGSRTQPPAGFGRVWRQGEVEIYGRVEAGP